MLAPRPRVLVTDAGERSVLAATRGLHQAGFAITLAGYDSLAPARFSRLCSGYVRVRDPRRDASGFVTDLCHQLEREPTQLLLAGTDFSLLAVSAARARLEPLAALGLPSHEHVEQALDRSALAAAAGRAGLGLVPAERCTTTAEGLAAAARLGFPLIVKSELVVRSTGGRIVRGRGTARVENAAELERNLNGQPGEEPFLLQRILPGRTLSFGGFAAGGRLLGACLSRYERTWPVRAGNVAASTTVALDARTEHSVAGLLSEIGWDGIFEVELIASDSGVLTAIDLNPRPYGSMALAIAAGANLPDLWARWALGEEPSPARAAAGRRYRWEDAELRHLLWQVRRGRWRAALGVARPRRHVVHPHFSARDPLPLLIRMLVVTRAATRKARSADT